MSKRDASLLIEDMIESARKIARYVVGMDYEAFVADDKTAGVGGMNRGRKKRLDIARLSAALYTSISEA